MGLSLRKAKAVCLRKSEELISLGPNCKQLVLEDISRRPGCIQISYVIKNLIDSTENVQLKLKLITEFLSSSGRVLRGLKLSGEY